MAAKKEETKKQDVTKANPEEVKKLWLQDYCAPKNSAAKICTAKLLSGATIADLKTLCREYAKAKGGKQQWGCKEDSNADLMGHIRWISAKGYHVSLNEKTGEYKIVN